MNENLKVILGFITSQLQQDKYRAFQEKHAF